MDFVYRILSKSSLRRRIHTLIKSPQLVCLPHRKDFIKSNEVAFFLPLFLYFTLTLHLLHNLNIVNETRIKRTISIHLFKVFVLFGAGGGWRIAIGLAMCSLKRSHLLAQEISHSIFHRSYYYLAFIFLLHP